ncbi:uncharacterized protein LOC144919205 [Branchiostoma floridae x Branchiostoma belcheri]
MLSSRPPNPGGAAVCKSQKDDPKCRLCQKSLMINGIIHHANNLFKLKRSSQDTETPAARLQRLGVPIERDPTLSDVICQACYRQIPRMEKVQATLTAWKDKTPETTEPSSPRNARGLTYTTPSKSPAHRQPPPSPSVRGTSTKRRGLTYTPGKSPARKRSTTSRMTSSSENIPPPPQNSHRDSFPSGGDATKVEVHVQFPSDKVPRVKKMEGGVKSIVQQLTNGKWGAAASSILKHEEMTVALRGKVAEAITQEGKMLGAVSVLGRTAPKDLLSFKLENFDKELKSHAPWLNSCLQGACGDDSRTARCTAASVLLRVRHPKLSAIQYRNSFVALHGGAKKVVYERLNKQQLCMSHTMTLQKQTEFGQGRDDTVLAWKSHVEAQKETVSLLNALREELQEQERVDRKASLDTSGKSTISSSDLQDLDFSFQTYEPAQPSMDLDLGVMPLSEEKPTAPAVTLTEILNSIAGYKEETYKLAEQAINSITAQDQGHSPLDIVIKATKTATETPLKTYQIIIDNVDFTISAKHQSSSSLNQLIHWIQQYGALDRSQTRAGDDRPQKSLDDFRLEEAMPTEQVQLDLKRDYTILVARDLVKYLAAFKVFKDVVVRHIPHEYSAEMEQPSEQTWLGLQFKNENLSKDMTDILRTIQTNYVPCEVDEDGNITAIVQRILLGGDWLTEERAEGVQAAFKDGDTPAERLDGVEPKHELWHQTRTLCVTYNDIFDKNSAGDRASLRANMNVIGATNARKGPHAAYDAWSELFEKDRIAFIICAAKKIFRLQSEHDPPESIVPDQIMGGDRHTRSDWLHSRAAEIVDLAFQDEAAATNRIVEGIESSRFKCRQEGCNKSYVRPRARELHEQSKHNLYVPRSQSSEKSKEDGVKNYQAAKLSMALLIKNLKDATREGDGERVARCLKMALLFFRAYGHTKYAMGTFLFFVRVEALLPANLAHSLKWNRFINTAGGKGRNIPLDLRLEQMNNLLKAFLKHLGPNLNETTAARIADCIGQLEAILKRIDSDLGVTRARGYHHKGDPTEDIFKLVEQYEQANVLEYQPGRQYNAFPGFQRDLLAKLNVSQMAYWMQSKLKHWKALYE